MSIEAEEREEERLRHHPPTVSIELRGKTVIHYSGPGLALTMCKLEHAEATKRELWETCHGTDEPVTCSKCREIHDKRATFPHLTPCPPSTNDASQKLPSWRKL